MQYIKSAAPKLHGNACTNDNYIRKMKFVLLIVISVVSTHNSSCRFL